jgi:adenine-specific DNA-methyltransferase
MDDYLKTQIITYMGNKRKFLPLLETVIDYVTEMVGTEKLNFGDGFSGSGVVSRLFKTRALTLYSNDIAGYAETLNKCYLSTPTKKTMRKIEQYVIQANKFAIDDGPECPEWIAKHWAPSGEISEDSRVYFTPVNARKIDRYRHFILDMPIRYRHFLLAPLLVECSIHNNTSGQFSAFYRDGKLGAYGGKKAIDLGRITQEISIDVPVLSTASCESIVSRVDTNQWAREVADKNLDLVYYDPPYNKHPYSIYYFMLDIINDWDTQTHIPATTRGQPKTWKRSPYNSFTNAKTAFEDLIAHTKSKFILISYNNGGIIPLDTLEEILMKYGDLQKIPVVHKTYNKYRGIANYKRKAAPTEVKEWLWLLDCRDQEYLTRA